MKAKVNTEIAKDLSSFFLATIEIHLIYLRHDGHRYVEQGEDPTGIPGEVMFVQR